MIKDVNIIAATRSDHSTILHPQEIEECQRGPGFWKMNTSLLTDENFVQKMKEKLDQWKKEGEEFSDVGVAWDWIKYNVRLFTINYSKEVAKTKREREEKLQRKLQIAQAQFQQTPCEQVEKILDDV